MSGPDVLSRVRKLLALAGSPNVHEAAAAAAAAQALIDRHRLADLLRARTDPADAVTDGAEAPIDTARRLRPWRIVLAGGLARANGCVAYTAARGTETELRVAGRAADRAAVAALYGPLARQLEWLSATHGPGRARVWHDSFRVGAAEAVVARLAAGADEPTAVRSEPGDPPAADTLPDGAVVRFAEARAARAAAVEAFVEEHLGLSAGRAIRVDARGFRSGSAAGAALPLPGAGGDGTPPFGGAGRLRPR